MPTSSLAFSNSFSGTSAVTVSRSFCDQIGTGRTAQAIP